MNSKMLSVIDWILLIFRSNYKIQPVYYHPKQPPSLKQMLLFQQQHLEIGLNPNQLTFEHRNSLK